MIRNKLFKWIGGKKWLSEEINNTINIILKNKCLEVYIEPFAGGLGSSIFALSTLKENNIKKLILNDVNTSVISVYKGIREHADELFDNYWKIECDYSQTVSNTVLTLNKIKDKELIKELLIPSRDFFNQKKFEFNKIQDKASKESVSLFLFLINHAFNGVYRENSKGEFNTPYNWEACIFDKVTKYNIFKEYEAEFNSIDIVFENMDAFALLEKYKHLNQESLFYFDPPYLNDTITENKYNKDHFGYDSQLQLLDYYKSLDNLIFSNHYLPLFVDFCIEHNFNCKEVFRIGNMNSDPTKRGQKVSEILAYKF